MLQGNLEKKVNTNITEFFDGDQKRFRLMGFAPINCLKIQFCVVRALFALRTDDIRPG